MARSTKASWLEGKGDLREADVEDVPVEGESVRVRGLPAAYSNEAQSEALEVRQSPRGDNRATVNTAKLEVLQFLHGVIEPEFEESEVVAISQKYGPAFKKVIAKIDELSGVDKEAIKDTEARFPASGTQSANGRSEGSDGSPAGSDGPAVRARAGA